MGLYREQPHAPPAALGLPGPRGRLTDGGYTGLQLLGFGSAIVIPRSMLGRSTVSPVAGHLPRPTARARRPSTAGPPFAFMRIRHLPRSFSRARGLSMSRRFITTWFLRGSKAAARGRAGRGAGDAFGEFWNAWTATCSTTRSSPTNAYTRWFQEGLATDAELAHLSGSSRCSRTSSWSRPWSGDQRPVAPAGAGGRGTPHERVGVIVMEELEDVYFDPGFDQERFFGARARCSTHRRPLGRPGGRPAGWRGDREAWPMPADAMA